MTLGLALPTLSSGLSAPAGDVEFESCPDAGAAGTDVLAGASLGSAPDAGDESASMEHLEISHIRAYMLVTIDTLFTAGGQELNTKKVLSNASTALDPVCKYHLPNATTCNHARTDR